jgi:hypothetical protein
VLRSAANAAGVESFDEWRIAGRVETSGAGGGRPRIITAPGALRSGPRRHPADAHRWHDVVRRRLRRAHARRGVRRRDPARAHRGGDHLVGRGTFDSTAPFDDSFEDASALSLLRAWAERFQLELSVRANGTTGYLVDLVTEVGASARCRTSRRERTSTRTQRTIATSEQATRVIPRGADGGGEKTGIGAVRWKVTAVNAGTKRITIADELGIVTPIQFDDQLNGWLVFRERRARRSRSSTRSRRRRSSSSATSRLRRGRADLLRVADAGTNTIPWFTPPWGKHASCAAPLYVTSAVNGGTKRVTLAKSSSSRRATTSSTPMATRPIGRRRSEHARAGERRRHERQRRGLLPGGPAISLAAIAGR